MTSTATGIRPAQVGDADRILSARAHGEGVVVNVLRAIVATLILLGLTGPARADIYGYVDAAGATHLATEKLDAHYELFLKSGESPSQVSSPDGALMKTRLFKRLIDHPNIAKYETLIRDAAMKNGLDPQLVKAVIAVESGFDAGAVSDKGAIGLMQVLPATGARYGLRADKKKSVEAKLADPWTNLSIGTRYLADLRGMFARQPRLALAAYNAGENAVARFRQTIPPFSETQAYVKLVEQFHAFYRPASTLLQGLDARASGSRIRVTLQARRNLPEATLPTYVTGAVVVPPRSTSPSIEEHD